MADRAALESQVAQQIKYDRKRLNELFRYFNATSHATHSKPPDIDSSRDYSQYLPRLAADPNLNALAQLGALRLDCERSFISLIDTRQQHIIAEVTRSISLYDAEIHNPGEQLCMGETPLDLFAGVCAGTMPIFTSQSGEKIQTQNIYADQSRYIINDFTQEDLYRERPYVTGYPYMRYYAEVPLKTKSGYVIGSYCVVDSKPRTGLEEEAFRNLNEIASAIMRHLDLIKTNDDHSRSIRMLEGLHRFAQDENRAESSERSPFSEPRLVDVSNSVELEGVNSPSVASPDRPSILVQNLPNSQKASHSTGNQRSVVVSSKEEHISRMEDNLASPPIASSRRVVQTTEDSGNGESTIHEPGTQQNLDLEASETLAAEKFDDTKAIFDKAAVTLCRAMDLDGVYFLDASAKSGQAQAEVGGLPQHTRQQGETNPSESFSAAGASMSLKLSSAVKSPLVPPDVRVDCSSERSPPLSNSIQQTLIREYPSGHIFNFDDLGRIPESTPTMKPDTSSNLQSAFLGTSIGSKTKDHPEVDVALRNALPGVTSVIFIPLWNAYKGTWFSSLLAWTVDAKRVLLQEDLSYCSAFGNSIMAEVTRVALVLTDRAKSDFISSMSHELRSPLHGILASAEFLRGMQPSPAQSEMINMIETCGRSLLDTMEHVLLYSKINSLKRKSLSPIGPDFAYTTPYSGDIDSPATFDLCTMVEETIESSVFGHRHSADTSYPENTTISSRQPTQFPSDPSPGGPLVLVVIEAQTSWKIRSEISTWRRILLNILGNALKYTSSGLITVTMAPEKHDSPSSHGSQVIELAVTDTGRGISQAYLQHHLYTPFTQENNLSAGVGLGLSIVRNLVENLNGSIHISSEQGVGTTVTLRLPVSVLEEPVENRKQVHLKHERQQVYLLGQVTQDRPRSSLRPEHRQAVVSAFKDQVKKWLGVDVIDANELSSIGAGTLVIYEDDIPWLISAQNKNISNFEVPANSCLLVLGMATPTELLAKVQPQRKIQTLSLPFGPRKLAKAMAACFDQIAAQSGETGIDLSGADTAVDHSSGSYYAIEPLRNLSLSANEPASSKLPTHTTSLSKGASLKHNLLLVDDNAINLKLLITFANKLGCPFTAVSNGSEALEAYQISRERFDYVLMDLSMPVMDGFAATSAIRSFERAQGLTATVVIALTGLGSEKARQEAADCGVDLFLTKPVSLKRLQQILTPRIVLASTYSGI